MERLPNRRIGIGAGTAMVLVVIGALARNFVMAGPDVPILDVGKDFPARDPSREEEFVVCPWRQPAADVARFFPDLGKSGVVREETLVFTRQRPLLAGLLGRAPTGSESALQIHRVLRRSPSADAPNASDSRDIPDTESASETPVGAIVTRYVRGASGVIELALAVDAQERVVGARLQRLREPDSVAQRLQSARFLGAFRGRTYASAWTLNAAVLPGDSGAGAGRVSAGAILEGARVALILLHVGEQTLAARRPIGSSRVPPRP